MPKYMAVLRRPHEIPIEAFRARLLDEAAPACVARGLDALALSLADVAEVPALAPARHDASVVAALASLRAADDAGARAALTILGDGAAHAALYRVREAVPRARGPRSWPLGEPTPGVKQVTLLRRRDGLDDAELLRRWFEVHTPLALRVHPIWDYNRNAVEAVLSPGAPAYDGIVELSFRELRDLADPARFFGGNDGARAIAEDVREWIDLAAIEVYAMREIVLREARNPG